MKFILSVLLLVTQASTSFAQEESTTTGYKFEKCTKEFCSAPSINVDLKKYCSLAPKEFQNGVNDWGPHIPLSEKQSCWCSCKFDVDQK